MTQDKELLLKDLCARLPYEVKFPMMCWDEEIGETVKPVTLYSINKDGYCRVSEDDYSPHIDEIKPYLFPLSSMTKEQESYLHFNTKFRTNRFGDLVVKVDEDDNYFYTDTSDYTSLIDWLNKNHFDYRGLIPKGLAIDATGQNIY